MLDTVIFDLDGTLLNTLDDLADSVNFALEAKGFPTRSLEEVRGFVGNGIAKLIERAVPDDIDARTIEETLSIFKKHYAENCENKTAPYEGILTMLSFLKEKGYKLAVVSNKIDSAVVCLCEKYFGSYLSVAVGDKEGRNKKPAPDSVFEVMERLNSRPEDCIYIGDSDVDILTAQNAGIPCISVTWGFRDCDFLIQRGARTLVNKPSDILDILVAGT